MRAIAPLSIVSVAIPRSGLFCEAETTFLQRDDELLHRTWHSAWAGIGVHGADLALQAQLIARYQESHRAYHTLQHLQECLALFEELRELAERPAEIAVALWFHDAIYDVHAHDNEARSADWAVRALAEAGVAPEARERIRSLVLATQHHATPESSDAQLLVDIDLSILGAAPERFMQYETQIRQEYHFVPIELFQRKRAAILQSFLLRARLYQTEPMHRRFETTARGNLSRSLAGLV
jgi:predicted metal-dependent HD superfamily phosphohydrolase